jgi:transcriptional regulator with XRE-family HTH domain
MISTAQVRAARGLLGWSQSRLANAASVSRATVNRAEATEGPIGAEAPLVAALVKAGIIFVEANGDGPGVRLKKPGKGKR